MGRTAPRIRHADGSWNSNEMDARSSGVERGLQICPNHAPSRTSFSGLKKMKAIAIKPGVMNYAHLVEMQILRSARSRMDVACWRRCCVSVWTGQTCDLPFKSQMASVLKLCRSCLFWTELSVYSAYQILETSPHSWSSISFHYCLTV
jgi:hypothetical protein